MAQAKQLASGNWRVQVYDKIGKRYLSITKPTEKEANFAALEYDLHHKNINSTPSNMTYDEALEKYINSKEGYLSPSTILGYKRLRKNTLQGLKNIALNKMTQEIIQKEITKEAKTHSPKSVRNMHGLLSAVFKEYNPDFVLRTILPSKQAFIPTIPTSEQIEEILLAVRGTEIELPILLALWMGLRMSEIRGIEPSTINGNTLYIVRAVVDVEKGTATKGTKTYSGTRSLIIPEYILNLIKKVPSGNKYLVPLSANTITKRFYRLLDKKNLPHFRFHDLRHTNASVMLSLNVPNKYAIERLGHATDNMLKKVYQHTMTDEKKKIDNAVNAYFNDKISHEISHA